MITLRQHKDDPDMVEILSQRPVSTANPHGGLIVWGVVHIDILGDVFDDDSDMIIFKRDGQVDLFCSGEDRGE